MTCNIDIDTQPLCALIMTTTRIKERLSNKVTRK
jgi:hypothetical protein